MKKVELEMLREVLEKPAEFVLDCRNQLGLRQVEFATLLHVTNVHVSHIETGHSRPSLDFLLRLVDIMILQAEVTYECNLIRDFSIEKSRTQIS